MNAPFLLFRIFGGIVADFTASRVGMILRLPSLIVKTSPNAVCVNSVPRVHAVTHDEGPPIQLGQFWALLTSCKEGWLFPSHNFLSRVIKIMTSAGDAIICAFSPSGPKRMNMFSTVGAALYLLQERMKRSVFLHIWKCVRRNLTRFSSRNFDMDLMQKNSERLKFSSIIVHLLTKLSIRLPFRTRLMGFCELFNSQENPRQLCALTMKTKSLYTRFFLHTLN